jgi:geranylgeranyl diphosphate synthase, type II
MHSPEYFQELIENHIRNSDFSGHPAELYDPIHYMMSLGGKRLRPVLLLMSHELFGGKAENILSPALGIEIFHNFTLLHDDIMDKAPLRRSQQTVHKKWNDDIAILSGDTMFVQSCMHLMKVNASYLQRVLSLFLKTAAEVCEGQQLDMNFEKSNHVSIDEYIHMIELKTAVLLGCTLSIGAICSDADEADINKIYDFGKNLGIAFQLHDDLLDVYGDSGKFGKQIGGDILANKKTFLLLTALENSKGKKLETLKQLLVANSSAPQEKISSVMQIYDELNVREQCETAMEGFYKKALESLENISVPGNKKEGLRLLAAKLMVREK